MSAWERVERDGHVYHIEDGHVFEEKSAFVWKEKMDKKSGKAYYTNLGSGDKKWSLPFTAGNVTPTTSKKALKSAASTLSAASLHPTEPLAAPFNFPGALLAFNASEPALSATKTPLKKSSTLRKKSTSQNDGDEVNPPSTLKRKSSKKTAGNGDASVTASVDGPEDAEGGGEESSPIAAVLADTPFSPATAVDEASLEPQESASSRKKLKKSSSKLKPKKKRSGSDATDDAASGALAEEGTREADTGSEEEGNSSRAVASSQADVNPAASPISSETTAAAGVASGEPQESASPKKKLKKSSSKLKPKKKRSGSDATKEADDDAEPENKAGDEDLGGADDDDEVGRSVHVRGYDNDCCVEGDAPQVIVTSSSSPAFETSSPFSSSQVFLQDGDSRTEDTLAETVPMPAVGSADTSEAVAASPRRASRQVSFILGQQSSAHDAASDSGANSGSETTIPTIAVGSAAGRNNIEAIRREIARDLSDDDAGLPTRGGDPAESQLHDKDAAPSASAGEVPSWSDLRASFTSMVTSSRGANDTGTQGGSIEGAASPSGVRIEPALPIRLAMAPQSRAPPTAVDVDGSGVSQQGTSWHLEDVRRGSGMDTIHVDPLDPCALSSPLGRIDLTPSTTRRYVLPAAVHPHQSSPPHHDDEQLTPFRVRIADDGWHRSADDGGQGAEHRQLASPAAHPAATTAESWADELQPMPRPIASPRRRTHDEPAVAAAVVHPTEPLCASLQVAARGASDAVEVRNFTDASTATTALDERPQLTPVPAQRHTTQQQASTVDTALCNACTPPVVGVAASTMLQLGSSSAALHTSGGRPAPTAATADALQHRALGNAAPRQVLPRVSAASRLSSVGTAGADGDAVPRRQPPHSRNAAIGAAGRVPQSTPRYPSSFAPRRTVSRSPDPLVHMHGGGGPAGTSSSATHRSVVGGHPPRNAMHTAQHDIGIQRGTAEHAAMTIVESGFVHCSSRNVGRVPSTAVTKTSTVLAESTDHSRPEHPPQASIAPQQQPSIVIYASSPPAPSPAAVPSHRPRRSNVEQLPRKRDASSSESEASVPSRGATPPRSRTSLASPRRREASVGRNGDGLTAVNVLERGPQKVRGCPSTMVRPTHVSEEAGRRQTAYVRAVAANRVLQSTLTTHRLHINTSEFPRELRPFLREQEVFQLQTLQRTWQDAHEKVARLRHQIARFDDGVPRQSTALRAEIEAIQSRQAVLSRNLMRTHDVQWHHHLAQLGGASQ